MKLLLASKSPRRRELIASLGLEVEYVAIHVDEHLDVLVPASEMALHIARKKANSYPIQSLPSDTILVTADTTVVLGNDVLGKPATRAEAVGMLHRLSGKRHTVFTGVCLRSSSAEDSFSESTGVYFRDLTDKEIEYYVDTYHPYDKAGAYGIQEWIGMVGIERIEGCYYNVMGLPVARLYDRLTKKFLSR